MVDEYTRHLERNKEVKGKGLSQFRMKVLADVLLFFSPFSVAVLPHIVGTPSRENMFALSVCVIGEAISWASIPMFSWLLYQGFEWTGNAWLYGLRLLVLALVCEVPFLAAAFGFTSVEVSEYLIALALAVCVIPIVELVKFFQRKAEK